MTIPNPTRSRKTVTKTMASGERRPRGGSGVDAGAALRGAAAVDGVEVVRFTLCLWLVEREDTTRPAAVTTRREAARLPAHRHGTKEEK
jgi:hypothetical protein